MITHIQFGIDHVSLSFLKKIYLFIYLFSHSVKYLSCDGRHIWFLFDKYNTNFKQGHMYVTFPYICGFWEIEIWNFSQSESITDHSSHTEFTMEQES
jgi:hypothetical protein